MIMHAAQIGCRMLDLLHYAVLNVAELFRPFLLNEFSLFIY